MFQKSAYKPVGGKAKRSKRNFRFSRAWVWGSLEELNDFAWSLFFFNTVGFVYSKNNMIKDFKNTSSVSSAVHTEVFVDEMLYLGFVSK